MPKPVHDMVNKLLADPDFYPEKSEKQQKAIAWATAWSQYKKRKKKKSDNEYSATRKAELIKLNQEINLLEEHGFTKAAQILDNKFNELSNSSSDVITVEAANGGYQIVLNGEMPYKRMDTKDPVIFDNLKQAQIYAQKLANSEDYIYKP